MKKNKFEVGDKVIILHKGTGCNKIFWDCKGCEGYMKYPYMVVHELCRNGCIHLFTSDGSNCKMAGNCHGCAGFRPEDLRHVTEEEIQERMPAYVAHKILEG